MLSISLTRIFFMLKFTYHNIWKILPIYLIFNRVDLHIKKLRYNEGIFAFTSSELEVLSFVAWFM